MDREEVTEFLGQVPLLQCLPGSSIRRIAEAVQVKHYESGDYVAREGEPVDGLCIILDGQAEVSAPANTEEANRPDYVLNKYDYFGYGTNSSVHQVNVTALTKKEELGFEHQAAIMPAVPPPEQLLNMEEIRERRLTDPRFPMQYRNSAAKKKFVPWPIEMRFCQDSGSQHKPSLYYWFRARGKLSDDPALHRFAIYHCRFFMSYIVGYADEVILWYYRCVVAYASDLLYSGVSLNPHRERGLKTYSLSLDHSMWFHKPVKADDWLLYVIDSPSAHGGRGFVTGRMFNRQGELVVSLTQEALIRRAKTPGQTPRPKL
ncbi:hypothetical protein ACQ4PT_032149 [Festuca glaucescens]